MEDVCKTHTPDSNLWLVLSSEIQEESVEKCTFERTLGHPVDLSTCRGPQQATQPREQQWSQQQHGVSASDLHWKQWQQADSQEAGGTAGEDAEVLEMRWGSAPRSLLSGGSLQSSTVSLLLTLWALSHTVVQGICL